MSSLPLVEYPENVYGSRKRMEWISRSIRRSDRIVEFGCGTGLMLTIPLIAAGYDAYGVDIHEASVEYGRRQLEEMRADPGRLRTGALDIDADVIIASEVLEHISTRYIDDVIRNLRDRLRPGGRLLVTVPNGYGWFELESAVWRRTGLGFLLERLRFPGLMRRAKNALVHGETALLHRTTLADDVSPHVQRFTLRSITKLLTDHGFEVESVRGSTMFSGPLSDTLWSGIVPLMKANSWLGERFPAIASGFYLVCTLRGDVEVAE